MRLKTPFTIIKKPIPEILTYSSKVDKNKSRFSWKKECDLNPGKLYCKSYEV